MRPYGTKSPDHSAAWTLLLALMTLALSSFPAWAARLYYRKDGQERMLVGNVIGRDGIGNVLFEGQDSQRHVVYARDQIRLENPKQTVPLYNKQQLQVALQKEYGGRFRFHHTRNYMICHSCSADFAREAGKLFERANVVFTNFFRSKGGFTFERHKQPLVAVIFASRQEYMEAMQKDHGDAATMSAGMYSPMTNRMYMYANEGGKARAFSRPAGLPATTPKSPYRLDQGSVSTIVHEGVHQIAYNSGFHNRHGHNPKWLVEGMATYFESPNTSGSASWTGTGELNMERFDAFRKKFDKREKDSLKRLITDDGLFANPTTIGDAYAEAWAFTYFLARTRTTSYVRYLRIINDREPLSEYTPEERLADFRKAFGKSPEQFDLDFRRYMSALMTAKPTKSSGR